MSGESSPDVEGRRASAGPLHPSLWAPPQAKYAMLYRSARDWSSDIASPSSPEDRDG